MLVRLISERQVIVQFNGTATTLFKAGEVYIYQGSGFAYVPVPREQSVIPVWTLIDVDSGETGAPLTEDLLIWPIQASSPKPVRWRSWSKQFRSAIWGLPLWTLEELVYGYVFGSLPSPVVFTSLSDFTDSLFKRATLHFEKIWKRPSVRRPLRPLSLRSELHSEFWGKRGRRIILTTGLPPPERVTSQIWTMRSRS